MVNAWSIRCHTKQVVTQILILFALALIRLQGIIISAVHIVIQGEDSDWRKRRMCSYLIALALSTLLPFTIWWVMMLASRKNNE